MPIHLPPGLRRLEQRQFKKVAYETFLKHTNLKTIQWVNIGRQLVTFRTIQT